MSIPLRIPLLIGIVAIGASAMGQSTTKITYDGRPEKLYMPRVGISSQDAKFLKDAAVANMFEIESSKLAADRSSDTFVLQFAKEMVADHKSALDELATVASNKGVTLPTGLPADKAKIINRLKGLRGDAFDRAYKAAQSAGHSGAKALFERQVKAGHDEDARDYAVKTLPAVTMHLHMLKMGHTMTGPTKAENNQ
jgi:putative membrane protein